jgi:hypothetical protein
MLLELGEWCLRNRISSLSEASAGPNTRRRAELTLAELPETEKRQIRWENAAKLFSIEAIGTIISVQEIIYRRVNVLDS